MRLGIDIDGVLAHFTKAYWLVCKKLFNKPVDFYEPDSWGFTNYNLTPEQHKEAWVAIKATPDFWLDLSPYDQRVSSLFHPEDVEFFITSRAKTAGHSLEWQTSKWLRDKLGYDYPCTLVCDNKGEVARALKLDTFIDDRIENCEDVRLNSPTTKVFVLDHPWNKDYNHVTRVNSMEEFLDRSHNG